MASELYNNFGGQAVQSQQMSYKDMVLSRLNQMGINIPAGMSNDPNAIMQNLMQSGRVSQNQIAGARQRIMQMMGRR